MAFARHFRPSLIFENCNEIEVSQWLTLSTTGIGENRMHSPKALMDWPNHHHDHVPLLKKCATTDFILYTLVLRIGPKI